MKVCKYAALQPCERRCGEGGVGYMERCTPIRSWRVLTDPTTSNTVSLDGSPRLLASLCRPFTVPLCENLLQPLSFRPPAPPGLPRPSSVRTPAVLNHDYKNLEYERLSCPFALVKSTTCAPTGTGKSFQKRSDDILFHTSLLILYQTNGMVPEIEAEGNKARVLDGRQQSEDRTWLKGLISWE
jgi:hypothetical protein